LREIREELERAAFQFHYEIYRFRGDHVDLLGRLTGIFDLAGYHDSTILGEEVALAIKGALVAQFIRRSSECEGWCKGANPFAFTTTAESTLTALIDGHERAVRFEKCPGGALALQDLVYEARDRFGRGLFKFHAHARYRKRLAPERLLELLHLKPLTIGSRSDWTGKPILAAPEIEKLCAQPPAHQPLLIFGALREAAKREMEWAHGYRAGA
ncbi:MAG TPA: hypothetical protein VGH90_05595, partial [Chthoniobacteraceae bacterium]